MLGDALKAVTLIDNRAGAGGSIGAKSLARAAPDGQTLLIGTVGTQAINAALYPKLPYDAVRDFTPIAVIALAPVTLVMHPSQPVNNARGTGSACESMPGKLNYGSAGAGTPGHLTGEMFKVAAGIDIQHVPYKGSAPALTDLLGGQIQIMFDPLQSVLSNVQGDGYGRSRSPARPVRRFCPTCRPSPSPVTTASRPPPGGECLRPARMPEAVTAALVGEIERIVASEGFRSKLEPLGVLTTPIARRCVWSNFSRANWRNGVKRCVTPA